MNLKLWSLWGTDVYSGDPGVIILRWACTVEHILSVCSCIMHTAWHYTGRLTCQADSIVQCHTRQYFSISALPTQYWRSYVEKPAETQNTVAFGWLAIWSEHLSPIYRTWVWIPCVDMNTAWYRSMDLWGTLFYILYRIPTFKEISTVTTAYKVWTTFIDLWTVNTCEYSGFGTEIYMTKFSILIDYCICTSIDTIYVSSQPCL
jgi:hypothetical protein